MGREVRRVPADWQHPKDERGHYKPLYSGIRYKRDADEFMETANSKGLQVAVEDFGGAPNANDYMPAWPEEQCSHFMMYEDVSEGTPISPAFATPEELARWLADTGASACGDMTASYEGWLRVARGGFAPSMVFSQKIGIVSGVDGLTENT